MIHRQVFHNGHLLPIEQVRLSPGQAGLFCGWGLFTTLRIVQGEPFAFERHWRRLERDAARTRVPFPFDPQQVRAQLRELIGANEVREGTARIYAIYNQVGFWQSDEPLPLVDLLLYTAGLPPHREPARLSVTEHGRDAASPLSGVKVTSWLQNVWSLQGAQQLGFDETIMLNERGEVAECTAANIFCVRNQTVATPPLSSGCLEGVTRSVLLEIAPQRRNRGSRANLAPRGSLRSGRSFHLIDKPQPGWRGRDRGPHDSRRPRARLPCGWKKFFASTSRSTWPTRPSASAER